MAKKGSLRGKETEAIIQRPERPRKYKYLFLIVCEDSVTEPAYFRQFQQHIPEETIYLREIGTGRDPLGVVTRAISERKLLEDEAKKEVDVVWAVFDKDDADLNRTRMANWNTALANADANKIKLALSNEVFELWLLLHLRDVDPGTALSRNEVYQMLGEEINKHEAYKAYIYQHATDGGAVIPVIAAIGSQEEALTRAFALLDYHGATPAIKANPSTRVCLLIKLLLEMIDYHSWEED
jgi:hypothetical protein